MCFRYNFFGKIFFWSLVSLWSFKSSKLLGMLNSYGSLKLLRSPGIFRLLGAFESLRSCQLYLYNKINYKLKFLNHITLNLFIFWKLLF